MIDITALLVIVFLSYKLDKWLKSKETGAQPSSPKQIGRHQKNRRLLMQSGCYN